MNAPGRPKSKEQTEINRLNIIRAAQATFAAKGFDGANMREIAKAANVNKFMLYYHFDNKRALYDQIIQNRLAPVLERLTLILAADDPLEITITNIIANYQQLFTADNGELRSLLAREIAEGAPRLAALFEEVIPNILRLWRPKLENYMARPLTDEELAQHVHSIMMSIIGHFIFAPFYGRVFQSVLPNLAAETYHSTLADFIMRGVSRTRATPAATAAVPVQPLQQSIPTAPVPLAAEPAATVPTPPVPDAPAAEPPVRPQPRRRRRI